MINDIRIAITFKGHRKRKRLQKLLGDRYLDYLIDLWITVATSNANGMLVGWDEEDIAAAAGYEKKDPKFFTEALLQSGFLEMNSENIFLLHDWKEHQGWVVGSKNRTVRAKIAGISKWVGREKAIEIAKEQGINPEEYGFKTLDAGSNADSMQTALLKSEISNTGGYAPLPTPSPSPSPSPKDYLKDPPQPPKKGGSVLSEENFNSFWNSYPKKIGKGAAKKAWNKIKPTEETAREILSALSWQKKSQDWLKENGQFIPHPATYLNQQRWDDEPNQKSESSKFPVYDEYCRNQGTQPKPKLEFNTPSPAARELFRKTIEKLENQSQPPDPNGIKSLFLKFKSLKLPDNKPWDPLHCIRRSLDLSYHPHSIKKAMASVIQNWNTISSPWTFMINQLGSTTSDKDLEDIPDQDVDSLRNELSTLVQEKS